MRHADPVSEQNGPLILHPGWWPRQPGVPEAGQTRAAYTILMFQVDHVKVAVGLLKRRGVQFERYDGMNHERGITVGRAARVIAVRFKDSAGTSSLTGPAPSSASYRVRAEPSGAWTSSE